MDAAGATAAGAAPPVLESVACTSFSVTTEGGLLALCVNSRTPSRARTYTLDLDTSATVRLFTSVTVTGVTVVVVVIVAVADIPGFK